MILSQSEWLASGLRSEANGTASFMRQKEYITRQNLSLEHKSLAKLDLRRVPSRED